MEYKYSSREHHKFAHGAGSHAPKEVLFKALIITSVFMLVEFVGGLISGSLALIADAGHMLTDTGALLLAFTAVALSNKPADNSKTYGYVRLPVLAAFANGIILMALTVWIVIEAVDRFQNPNPIQSTSMFIVAVTGLLVNIFVFRLLHSSESKNINIRGAMLHVLGDLLGSIGAIVASLLIFWKNWLWADPVLSIFVSILILRSAWRLIQDSSQILLEGTPSNVDITAIKNSIMDIDEVRDVYHLHLWSLNEDAVIITLHVKLDSGSDQEAVLTNINQKLQEEHGIAHSTIQVELEKA